MKMKMKNFLAFLMGLLIFTTGIVIADTGINATAETQGIRITTSVIMVGNFQSSTDLAWTTTTNPGGLSEVPPLTGGAIYQAVYTEDTMSNGVGQIWYDKDLTVDTGEKLNGQSNIEAVKEIAFIGNDGAQIYSDEYIMISGTAFPTSAKDAAICVFGSSSSGSIPAFCNRVEAGSTIDMSIVNTRTTTNGRFIVPSADTPVELTHNIRVDTLNGMPSQGKVSAFMQGSIQEGRNSTVSPFEEIEFKDTTTVDGEITLFDKVMSYRSGVKR
jgi:hypothetical protein